MAPYAGQYRTQTDLFNEALAKLGVLSSGQSVDPEDLNYVLAAWDGICRKLQALEIVSQASYDPNIPGVWFMDLASIVAGEVCTKFAYIGQEAKDFMDLGLGGGNLDVGMGMAAKSLKAMTRLKPTLEPLRVDYY